MAVADGGRCMLRVVIIDCVYNYNRLCSTASDVVARRTLDFVTYL
jgi:hypothetical protein